MDFSQLTQEQLHEMSLIEITYHLLNDKKQPIAFNELVDQIVALLGSTKEEVENSIAQFYTDLNIDGRFLNVGGNTWGIKGWYSVDQFEDDIVPTVTKKKKKAKILDDDLVDEYDDLDDEDLEDDYEEDFDDVDLIEDDEDFDEDLDDVEDEFEEDDLVEEEEDILLDEEFEDDEELEEDLDEFVDDREDED